MGRPRAVGYVRVSTEGQVDRYGPKAQEADLRECAKAHGLRLIAVLHDDGVSGAVDHEERPGLSEALDMIAEGQAGVLLVPKLDRLARELTVQEAALAQVWKHGGSVYACDMGEVPQDDPDDPMRTAMRQMVGVFAQLERGMIRARLRRGKRQKEAEGGYVGGRPPYGWKAEGGELVPDENEQEVLRLAGQLREEGRSLREIADALDAAGHEPKGERWHPTTLARMLERAS